MWTALRTCPHIHSPSDYDYDYDYDDDEDHLATYTLDGTHTTSSHGYLHGGCHIVDERMLAICAR